MSHAVDVPGGQAILREQEDLRGRDRNLIKAAAMAASSAIDKMPDTVREGRREGETEEQMQARLQEDVTSLDLTWQESLSLLELRQATVVAVLESWTVVDPATNQLRPLPTMDTIGDLPADLYDALDAAIGGVTTAVANATDFDDNPDHDSPTGGSTSSDTPSEGAVEPQ